MMPSTTQLLPGGVHNAALAAAKSRVGVAKWFLWIGAFFAFAAVALALDSGGKFNVSKQSPAEMLGGGAVWVAILWGIAAVFMRKSKRLKDIAATVTANPSMIWFLNGHLIVAADATGVPHPELSFKISEKLRVMLTTVPEVRARPFGG